MQRLARAVPLHHALFLQDVGNSERVGVLVGGDLEVNRDKFAANNVGRVPSEHEREHFIECSPLRRGRTLIEIHNALDLAGIGIDQVADDHGLEASHVNRSRRRHKTLFGVIRPAHLWSRQCV